MAILGSRKVEPKAPVDVQRALDDAILAQHLAGMAKANYEAYRDGLVEAIEASDVEIGWPGSLGKKQGLHRGSVVLGERRNYDYDLGIIQKAVEDGVITLTAVLSAVGSFRAKEASVVFDGVEGAMTEGTVTEYITCKPCPEAKSHLAEKVDVDFSSLMSQIYANGECPICSDGSCPACIDKRGVKNAA